MTPAQRSDRRVVRRLALAAAIVGGLVLVSALAVAIALRSQVVRLSLLSKGSAVLEGTVGVRLTAEDLRLERPLGRLVLVEPRLAAGDAAPFLRASRIVVAVDVASAWRSPLVIRELLIENPELDLAAPLPNVPTQDAEPRAEEHAVPRLDSVVVSGGRVSGGNVPDAARAWLEHWRLDGIEATGSLQDDVLTLSLQQGRIRFARPESGTDALDVALELRGPLEGPLHLDSLSLRGEGLRVRAEGELALSPEVAFSGDVDLDAWPGRLIPERGIGGAIRARAAVSSRPISGTVEISATDLAVDAVRPFVDATLFERLGAAATFVDVGGTATASGDPLRLEGTAAVTWRRAGELLARAETDLAAHAGGVVATMSGVLLPDAEGERSLRARLVAQDLAGLVDGRVEDAEIRWQAADLPGQIELLRGQWPQLVPELPTTVGLDGPMDVRVRVSGAPLDPDVRVAGLWQPALGGALRLSGSGRPVARRGRAELSLDALPIAVVGDGLSGSVSGVVTAEASATATAFAASLEGRGLSAGGSFPTAEHVRLEAASDGRRVAVTRFEASLGETHVTASGQGAVALPLGDAAIDVDVLRPVEGVQRAAARITLAAGTLRVLDGLVESSAGTAFVTLEVPLAALASLPHGAALAELPVQRAGGLVHLEVLAPDIDSCRVADALGLPDRPERGRLDLQVDLWVDPARPASAFGSVVASGIEAQVGGGRVRTDGPLELRVGAGRVGVGPLQLLVAETGVRVAGRVALRPDWQFGDDPMSLMGEFSGEASGRVDTALLEPYLAGVSAAGSLVFGATAAGTPSDPRASFELRGEDASLAWATPYALRVSQPVFAASYADGAFTLWSGEMAVNRGKVSVRGTFGLSGRGELQTELEDVRLRLDYGLRAVVSGEAVLALWPGQRPLLSGTVTVQRGVLDRDLDLEREVLAQFLAPVVTAGTEDHPLDRVDLDLTVGTGDGIRVKNNLADLTTRWERIDVGGTAWNPRLRGTVSIDPGGLLYAYGQTVRIDRGELQFTGDPVADPRIELATTGSWQDPTIPTPGQEASPFAAAGVEESAQVLEAFSTGIAGYYGERLASRIGESLGLGRVSLRPVLVFGETDPSARLTISREISRSVALAVSLDLRNAQRQTYVLDVRDLPRLGAFRAQVFTNDDGREGGSLQQVLEFGGSKTAAATGPALDRVVWDAPEGLPRRVLERAVSLKRGAPLPDGAAFDLEIELEHELRRAGWPAATISVVQRPGRAEGHVELAARVVPGPRVGFEFTGDLPPKSLRSGITDLYRPGAGTEASELDARRQTVRVLRSIGYLDPAVEVRSRQSAGPDGPVLVTVHSRGGVRAELGPPRFEGVVPDVAARLAERFPGAVERAELALGLPEADARVLAALREMGYPRPRLANRFMTVDLRELVVEIEPGPRREVALVIIDGVGEEVLRELRRLAPVAAGDPLRTDLVARGAAAMEERLRLDGYARAAVRASVEGVADGTLQATVRYDIRPGQRYELDSISVFGNRWTGENAVRSLAALEPGTPFRAADVAAARARLLRSGRFSRVMADTELGDGLARVELQIVERQRFQLAYGLRYESDVGTSAVVDLLDRNLFGRGVVAGLRLRWEPDDRSGRLFLSVPELFGWGVAVETYGERRREVRGGLVLDVGEAALQLSAGVGRSTVGRIYARYRDTRLAEVEPDPFFPFEVRITHPYLGVQLVHDRRDDVLQPRSGVLATLDLSGSGSFVGSDFSYVRGYGQVNLYRSVGRVLGRSAIWAQSYRIGLAHAFEQDLIPDVRFYAGGEFSLRGYPNEGVGPVDELGSVISPAGGAAVMVVNHELRLALPWDLTGVGFVDVGGVWAELEEFGTDLVTSLGVGVRAATPVGLLRVDFAVPLDRRDWEPRYKLYAGFGNAF